MLAKGSAEHASAPDPFPPHTPVSYCPINNAIERLVSFGGLRNPSDRVRRFLPDERLQCKTAADDEPRRRKDNFIRSTTKNNTNPDRKDGKSESG